MSTEFMPRRRIAFERIRNFNHRGVTARPEDDYLFLSDGTNFMHVYPAYPGRRVSFVRQGDNDILMILAALEDYFNVRLVSEYEDEFFDIIKIEERQARRARKKARDAKKMLNND